MFRLLSVPNTPSNPIEYESPAGSTSRYTYTFQFLSILRHFSGSAGPPPVKKRLIAYRPNNASNHQYTPTSHQVGEYIEKENNLFQIFFFCFISLRFTLLEYSYMLCQTFQNWGCVFFRMSQPPLLNTLNRLFWRVPDMQPGIRAAQEQGREFSFRNKPSPSRTRLEACLSWTRTWFWTRLTRCRIDLLSWIRMVRTLTNFEKKNDFFS